MKPFYFFGSALFLILAVLKVNDPKPGIWLGAYGYAAILGMYGQMDRKKLLFTIGGMLGYFGLLYHVYSGQQIQSFLDPQLPTLLSLVGCVLWMGVLFAKWKKEGHPWY